MDFSSAPRGRTHLVTQRNEALMSCRDHLRCLRHRLAAVGRLAGRQGALLPSRSADHRIPVSNTRLSALMLECRPGAAPDRVHLFPSSLFHPKICGVFRSSCTASNQDGDIFLLLFVFCTRGVFPECLPGGWEHMASKMAARQPQHVSMLVCPNVPFYSLDWA